MENDKAKRNIHKQYTVLLVEDDKFIASTLEEKLVLAGYEVIKAEDGIRALTKAKFKKPDLILLDIILPEKNGYEVLKDLKEDEKLKNIPVVILSCLGEKVDIQLGKQLGAIDHFVKSKIEIGDLPAKIKPYFNK